MKKYYRIQPIYHGWGYGYGFFSNYRICLEHLIHHHETKGDGIPYIDWGRTTWVEGFTPNMSDILGHTRQTSKLIPNGNPFDYWFDQDIPQADDIIVDCTVPRRSEIIDHSKHYFDEPDQLIRQQTVDKLYIKPKQFILDKVDKIYEKELKGYTTLGMMIRGTEFDAIHPEYGIFTIHDYIKKIQTILDENPQINKLFFVSEDGDYIEALSKAFPNSYYVPNVFRKTDETPEYYNKVHCWIEVSTKRENHCRLLGEEAIVQTKLLGKCDYLFGKTSGLFCGGILWNENIKKVFKI
jgi:hypothetical protein